MAEVIDPTRVKINKNIRENGKFESFRPLSPQMVTTEREDRVVRRAARAAEEGSGQILVLEPRSMRMRDWAPGEAFHSPSALQSTAG
jgi:hypothetical protein